MSVNLAATALIDEAELSTFIGSGSTLNVDDARRVCNRASALVQQWLRRNLITPVADVVEFHTIDGRTSEIDLLDYPIVSVTSVYEDDAREYGAETQLDADQFIVVKPLGRLKRCEPGSGLTSFMRGDRAIRVAYKYGWTRATLPEHFKDFAGQIAAVLWSEKKRAAPGATSMSDSMGNFTRIDASHLPESITAAFEDERAPIGDKTGERDE